MKRKVYVIVMIEGDLEEHGFAVEPLGVFSSEKKQLNTLKNYKTLHQKIVQKWSMMSLISD